LKFGYPSDIFIINKFCSQRTIVPENIFFKLSGRTIGIMQKQFFFCQIDSCSDADTLKELRMADGGWQMADGNKKTIYQSPFEL
jgi:hypothetical protein